MRRAQLSLTGLGCVVLASIAVLTMYRPVSRTALLGENAAVADNSVEADLERLGEASRVGEDAMRDIGAGFFQRVPHWRGASFFCPPAPQNRVAQQGVNGACEEGDSAVSSCARAAVKDCPGHRARCSSQSSCKGCGRLLRTHPDRPGAQTEASRSQGKGGCRGIFQPDAGAQRELFPRGVKRRALCEIRQRPRQQRAPLTHTSTG